jgi:DNA-binding CsgD family transcriptional regulator
MDPGAHEPLREAQAALAAGKWATAADAFRAVLDDGTADPDALFGLGAALFWLGDTDPALRQWEAAYLAYRRRADPAGAAIAAGYLSLSYAMSLGNTTAARGWLERASRLVGEHGLTDLQAWILLCRAHLANDKGRHDDAERWAREARGLAIEGADLDLELWAVSEVGAALVERGQIEEGSILLDEAMAGALAGEARDRDAVVVISCRSIAACSRIGEFQRATQWIRAADDFYKRYGSPHLYTTCRTQYGGVLFVTGRWAEAEQELNAALRIGSGAEPALRAEALARLAELRLAQGRIDEASRLLAGFEDHPVVTEASAMLLLIRGQPTAATVLLRRRLRSVDEDSLAAVLLAELLIESQLAAGAQPAAVGVATRVARLGAGSSGELLRAHGNRALGRVAWAGRRRASAVRHLEDAVASFGRLEMPLETARTRMLLAVVLAADEPEAAINEARHALTGFDALGATRDADAAAAFLRSLGVRPTRGGSAPASTLTRRELEVLALLGEGLSNREIGDRLFITRKTVEHHVANVLAKVGLSGRGEAAAYAVRHLERDVNKK